MRKSHDSVFTIGIGGAAGDGVRESGTTMGTILADLGYEVFLSFNYPSLIRGGHNFARLTFSKEKIYCDHEALDVLIALNEETITLHRPELAENAVVFADSFEAQDIEILKNNAVTIAMANTAKELNAPAITRNSMALGATCYLLDLNFDLMQNLLGKVFKDKNPELNTKLADLGYQQMKKMNFRHEKKIHPTPEKKELIDGNAAFGQGLIAAGLDFYVAYPMTPATSILHFLANKQTESNMRVIQPESELSVINMALGMAYAGKRVAVGSASGGFALMQEAFSCAGIAELPLVVAVSQRQAPATGLPTYSSQTDLRFAIHAGHGEFPRIIMAPGDSEEAFEAGIKALNLAWKYQIPVIVLIDKIISEHSLTSLLKSDSVKVEYGLTSAKTGEKYGRYEITEDGISPMAFPGTPNTVVKVTSYEHDEAGITVDEAGPTSAMLNKRFAKSETLNKSLIHHETVKIYGDHSSENVVLFWGSTKGPVLEAARYLTKPVKFVQVVWMEPFDTKKVTAALSGTKKIIDVECNHNGQLAALVREKTGIAVTDMVLKYDSRPFEPITLAEEINKKL